MTDPVPTSTTPAAPSPVAAEPADISARGATGVGVASLAAAAAGYLVLLIAANVLDKAQNADFLTFWGLLFFLFGTLGGLQSEVTRAVHVARTAAPVTSVPTGPSTDRAHGPRVLVVGLLLGTALAALVTATAPLWAGAVLGPQPWAAVAVVALGTVAFAGHSAVAGTLAGRGRWAPYAVLVGAEALVRLLLVAVAALAVAGTGLPTAVRVAAGAGATTWLLLSILPVFRGAWDERAESAGLLGGAAHAMVGTASSAALVVGFPVLLRVTTDPEVFGTSAAPLLLAVVLTRAPLLIPLNAYQGVAITYFLNHRGAGPLLRLGGMVLGVGIVGAAAAALVGPWFMDVLFPSGYGVEPLVLGGLTLTAAFLGLLTLSGAATLALGGHRAYAVGWVVATACSGVALLMPGSIEARVVLALAVGPLVGVLVHGIWVRSALRGRR